jgi:hypothetical protein
VRILTRHALNPPRKHVLGDPDPAVFPKEFNHVPEYKTFFDTLVDLTKNKTKECYNDLETSQTNIMKRSDGTFVIVDPWYAPDS